MILAFCSFLVKSLPTNWSQHIMLAASVLLTLVMTLLFARWAGLSLLEVGAAPDRGSLRKFLVAFMLGLFLPVVQWAVVLSAGGYHVQWNDGIGLSDVFFNLALYTLIAWREELAFRGFPLFSLNKRNGFLPAISIVTFIFILEHVAGGMSFWAACIGSGAGGVLFGILAIKTKGIAFPMGVHAHGTSANGQWG